jgi:sugar phosphate isomerase/epimerase
MKFQKTLFTVILFVVAFTILTSAQKEQIDIGQSKGISDNITLGVIIHGDNPEKEIRQIKDLGFSHCQLNISEYSHELAKRLHASVEKFKVYPTTLICMGPGDYIWNFTDGPSTIGLIPRKFRKARIKRLHQGIDFCNEVGIPAIHAHFGFIPEDPKDTLYLEFIKTMKELSKYALSKGIDIYFETGQETPVTLLRAISDIGTGNLFINYDLANLVMYGKSNSLDGLKILHNFIKAIHAKDGEYPTEPYNLGKEVPIPHGEVDFPAIIAYLKRINFKGNITIEYEISDKNYDYIIETKKYLESLIFYNVILYEIGS